jgi:pyruvate dehydrogenase E2 component (dihydrolipoamide acetyltransferase)
MATKIQMPKLSDTMEEGVILKWLRKEGEKVKQGETLVEIESDKADMELEAYDSGVLRKILVPEGSKAAIGALIAIIGEPDEDISSLLTEESHTPSPSHSKEADTEKPQPVRNTNAPSTSPVTAQENTVTSSAGRIKASPLAKRLATEHKLNLAAIAGSGPLGRVIKRDVENKLSGHQQLSTLSSALDITPGTSDEVPLSPIRKTIAKRMTESKTIAPHFYVTVEVDSEPMMAFREQINTAANLKIGVTDILIKACAVSLMSHPNVNATYLGNTMRRHNFAHIGIAVALDDGLVTPVIRNCEQKRIDLISAELRDVVERARNRKLKPEEYQGSTFTISNLGMFGVEDFSAIINPPESAILAVSSTLEKPIVKNGIITIGHSMKITLSSDHRVIDGALAARFLQDLKKLLENPAALALR